ncbi:DEDD exonuclease domain-containing protein [Jatrophihabitans telluris]|uniref:DEDD exonuclease domain-containing protein n=1 Tax=Jatrophihabitans telluris TaxID=2038343 RepID=A0ABY4R3X0_9ACTN|nr:DEDD exonuclease domain-containing protein [Jatrophihabitans telluris]UQX90310.1 DEDD exonuclease domain-containing protein [Jatrophihabitans telluris]
MQNRATDFTQLNFDELDEPLRATTFVVVDLETTGGAAGSDAITEIGAVKVCNGQILGEFATLVDPGIAITPFVSVLTGITDSMVAAAPGLAAVLPAFLEFASGSVLVAHNAPFDVGFLKAGCLAQQRPWPGFPVVDTAVLARRILTRDEVPNCKLSTLAGFFQAATTPNHRALSDARATVDVLHGLIARLGSLGVHSLPELRAFTAQVSDAQRRKRHLADGIPHSPGVYIFKDAAGTPLYVGTSKDLRNRVRQYFVASETRTRMGEMVGLAESVDVIVCAHALEAQVRELRLITTLKPKYNRRSKNSDRTIWLKLTREHYPRLSVVREHRPDGADYFGPLRSARQAEQLRDAIHDAVPIRQCTDKLVPGRHVRSACTLADIGRCSAPCEQHISVDDYSVLVARIVQAWRADVGELITPLRDRLTQLSTHQRYEEAALLRDRIATLVRSCARAQSLTGLNRIEELVAARPDGVGGWELAVLRHGRLVGSDVAARGIAPMPIVESLVATAEAVDDRSAGLMAVVEETEILLRWLGEPGVRLVRSSRPWALPAFGAGRQRRWLASAKAAVGLANPFADRRGLRISHQPTRGRALG